MSGWLRYVKGTTIRTKLTLFVILLLISTVGVLWFISDYLLRERVRDQVHSRLTLDASQRKHMLSLYIHQQLERLSLVSSRTHLRQLFSEYQKGEIEQPYFLRNSRNILSDALASSARFRRILMADRTGRVLTATDDTDIDRDVSDLSAFRTGLSANTFGRPRGRNGEFFAWLSGPAFSDRGETIGVVLVKLDIAPMIEFTRKSAAGFQSDEVLLGTREADHVVYMLSEGTQRASRKIKTERTPAMDRAIRGQTGYMEAVDYNGKEVLAAYRPLGYADWGIVVKIDREEAIAPLVQLRWFFVLAGMLVLLFGTGAAIWLARRFTEPILSMGKVASAMARGELDRTVRVESEDEIGQLGEVLNKLSAELRDYRQRMETKVQERAKQLDWEQTRFRALADEAMDAIVSAGVDGKITYFNSMAEQMFGYDREQAIGQDLTILMPEKYHEHHRKGFNRYLETGEAHVIGDVVELEGQQKNGEIFPIELSLFSWEAGGETFFTGIIRDISDRKRYEARLEQSNYELEQFAYVVSHDLQEPLRKIINFTELLEERFGDTLEDKALHYMDRVVDAAGRMKTMIEDLLKYSRVGRADLVYEEVDLNQLLEDLREVFSLKLEETGGRIKVGKLPTMSVVPGLIRQLFQNLIENALKYAGDDPPLVEIEAEKQGGSYLFHIADNGIGMEPDQRERIFEVFQRLHTRREYSGTGIGLAICQKVVQQHGGDIWVDSDPGEGTTFYLSIPVSPDPQTSISEASVPPIPPDGVT